jgi:hypothetical protein
MTLPTEMSIPPVMITTVTPTDNAGQQVARTKEAVLAAHRVGQQRERGSDNHDDDE